MDYIKWLYNGGYKMLIQKLKKLSALIALNFLVIFSNFALVTQPNEILALVEENNKLLENVLEAQIQDKQDLINKQQQEKITWENRLKKTQTFINNANQLIKKEKNTTTKKHFEEKVDFYTKKIPTLQNELQSSEEKLEPLEEDLKGLANRINNYSRQSHYIKIVNDIIFENKTYSFPSNAKPFLDQTSMCELPIFYDLQNPEDTLFLKIDNTHTHTGSLILATHLANPFFDEDCFKNNKEIIKALSSNEECFKTLDDLLSEFTSIEEGFLDNYSAISSVPAEQINELAKQQFHFLEQTKGRSFLNAIKNKLFGYKNFFSTPDNIASTLFNLFFYYSMVQAYLHPNPKPEISYKSPTFLISLALRLTLDNPIFSFLFMIITGVPMNDFFSLGFPILLAGSALKVTGSILKEAFWNTPQKKQAINFQIQNMNQSICALIDSVSEISKAIKEIPELKSISTVLEKFINEQKTLIKQLSQTMKDAFKDEQEKMKKLYKIILKNLIKKSKENPEKDTLLQALKAIGQLDYYLSLAKLVKEENYCLVNLSTNKNIECKFENLKDLKKTTFKIDSVQTNFATQEDLTTTTNAIILSHLGIAPATKATISPISYLHISLPHNMLVITN
jgi:hypothetical protein